MSPSPNREARREERLHDEQLNDAAKRRQRLIKLGSAGAFLAIVVIAVLVVISQSQSGGDPDHITDTKLVNQQLKGITQSGLVLGDLTAKVTLQEFGDLQCTACKAYAEEVLPQIIENQVRSGEVKLDFHNFTIIGPQSTPAAAAAIAAGQQGRGWSFLEIFYRNQGPENGGYVTDEFLTAVAKAAGVEDIGLWNVDRKSKQTLEEVATTTAEAKQLGFTGTPSFAIKGPGTSGLETLETNGSAGSLESAISNAG